MTDCDRGRQNPSGPGCDGAWCWGGETFADALRKDMHIARETTDQRSLFAEASWLVVDRVVERVKG